MSDISSAKIISFLSDRIIRVYGNNKDCSVNNVGSSNHINEESLDWINNNNPYGQSLAENSKAKVIIASANVLYSDILKKQEKIIIIVENPRKEIARIIDKFFIERKTPFISPNAIISSDAKIASSAYISDGCVIGKATIGQNSILKSNVVIEDNTSIGDNCIIQAGTIIGTDGLGCMREKDGTLVKFPHIGGVSIGDNVEIGANCQIAKGVFDNTIIKHGCKINGLCFIAHNCILNENVWITGDSMLCGSVQVGKNSTIYSNVIVRDQVHIGDGCTIGMGAVVTKNVPDKETWIGNPAHKIEKQ